MKPIYQKVVDTIPDYQVFLTPDELDESSRALAAEFPEVVEIFPIGHTREGRELLCLKVGDPESADLPEGERRPTALVMGVPHPNEPIGCMLIEHLSRWLASDKELRDELGYTWYFVKAWDADSLALNTWIKGPFTLSNYTRNFFRPASYEQVEWTFPIDYKTLHFHEPLPETEAMMALIDKVKPRFMYSLHNSGFGGVYWYQTHKTPEIWEEMRAIVEEQDLPLHLGEPEAPYAEEWAPALYKLLTTVDKYDYQEKYGKGDPAANISAGTSSSDYALTRYGSFEFVNEMPYFFDERIRDKSPIDRTRCDVALQGLDEREAEFSKMRELLEQVSPLIDPTDHFLRAFTEFTRGGGMDDATRAMVRENPDFAKPATVAEAFDSLQLRKFFAGRTITLLVRACESELARMDAVGEQNAEKRATLEQVRDTAAARRDALCEQLEQEIDYQVIPIKKLVTIQLACGLLEADYVRHHDL